MRYAICDKCDFNAVTFSFRKSSERTHARSYTRSETLKLTFNLILRFKLIMAECAVLL